MKYNFLAGLFAIRNSHFAFQSDAIPIYVPYAYVFGVVFFLAARHAREMDRNHLLSSRSLGREGEEKRTTERRRSGRMDSISDGSSRYHRPSPLITPGSLVSLTTLLTNVTEYKSEFESSSRCRQLTIAFRQERKYSPLLEKKLARDIKKHHKGGILLGQYFN